MFNPLVNITLIFILISHDRHSFLCKLMKTSVTIVIPIYKPTISSLETASLNQCFKILGNYNIVAVKPHSLQLNNYPYQFKEVYSFDDEYFKDISGYNKLMLSPSFYKTFLTQKFILIYQLDAFVFKDELSKWCNSGFDYIGAPWLREADYPDFIKRIKNKILSYIHIRYNKKSKNSDLPSDLQFENKVGNGGFSLRKTQKFYMLCLSEQQQITHYMKKASHRFNEDAFWSIEVNRKHQRLKIPNYKKAAYFALENNCEFGLKLTKGQLPFGCHAWDKNLDFWLPFLQEFGYELNDAHKIEIND